MIRFKKLLWNCCSMSNIVNPFLYSMYEYGPPIISFNSWRLVASTKCKYQVQVPSASTKCKYNVPSASTKYKYQEQVQCTKYRLFEREKTSQSVDVLCADFLKNSIQWVAAV